MKFSEVKSYVLELTFEDARDLKDYFDDTFSDADTSAELKAKARQLYDYVDEAVRF